MLNHRTCLWSRGNTQAQGRRGREATPGTQGLLGTMPQADTPPTIRPSAELLQDQDEKGSLYPAQPIIAS